jgi:hypothetical protein
VVARKHGKEFLNVVLESVQVGNTILDELRAKQLARVVPDLAVGGEDAESQETLPVLTEAWSLSIVLELCGENCFDVLLILREDDTLPSRVRLRSKGVKRAGGSSEYLNRVYQHQVVLIADIINSRTELKSNRNMQLLHCSHFDA